MGDFNTVLSITDGISRQEFYKDTEVVKKTINRINLIDIPRKLKVRDGVHILFKCFWNIYQNCPYVRS